MPPAIGKPCAAPLCSAIVTKGKYCTEHRRRVEREDYRQRRHLRASAKERGYGHRWTQYRNVFMGRFPLCVACLTRNKITQAEELDHIRPRSLWPELFWESLNHQPLCKGCHRIKTIQERRGLIYAAPLDLQPPLVQPILLHGPPGSGKTTEARRIARPGDLLIDMDQIRVERFGTMYRNRSGLAATLQERNKLLLSLSTDRVRGVFIVGAPTAQERFYWQSVLNPAEVHVLAGGGITRDECKRRISADDRRADIAQRFFPVVDGWFAAYEATLEVGAAGGGAV